MIDIKNFIIEQIKSNNPNADVRTGSVFRDLIVNPLSSIIAGYQKEHENFLNRSAVTDIATLAENELDAVGANFLLERQAGSYSVGNIKIYFSDPRAISFPAGTRFTSSRGLEFQTLATFTLSKFQMEQNIADFPNYDTGLIPVRAMLPGIDHNIPEGTSLTFASSIDVSPIRVVAATGFTGGTAHESNDTFFRRLKDTVHNKSLASAYAIKAKIQDNYDDVVNVKVVGSGHPLMIRDLTTMVSDIESYKSEDFYLVYSGQHTSLYDKRHMALLNFFHDPLPGEFPTMPAISGWTSELTTAQYQSIYKLADDQWLEENDQALIHETFNDLIDPNNTQTAFQLIVADNKWYVHDGANPTNEVFYIDEINIEGGKLRLGKYLDPAAEDKLLHIPYSQLALLNDMATSRLPGTTERLEVQLSGMVSAQEYNNTAPIFHREIDEHTGIQIAFTFSTTDNTVNGEMAYATVFRNSEFFQPQDGYGLAFRKQPDYLIRMAHETHTDADIATFTEQYGEAPTKFGTALLADKNLWKWNVYIVDNDVLQEEVWVGGEQLWDQTSGKNQFLIAGKAWIENDKTYNVKINIHTTLATEAWIYEEGQSQGTSIVIRGATVPAYVPIADDVLETEIAGRDTIYSRKNHFGLAVAQTRNCEWLFDDLTITSFASRSPKHLFRFKAADTEIASDSAFEINYYGVGYDPDNYAAEGAHSKVLVQIWNVEEDGWETLGTHTYTIGDSASNRHITEQFTPLSSYTDIEGFINIAAMAYNFGSAFPGDIQHGLRSYYIEINNIKPDTVHRGNAMDIYVQDPDNIIKGSTAQVMASSVLLVHNMPGMPGYIQEILEVREGISKVAYDPNSYTITNLDPSNSYSADNQYSITFDLGDMSGTLIEIIYRYWAMGNSLSTLLMQDDVRFPLADNKVKIMAPTVLNITSLIYSGGLPAEDMKLVIAGYINSLTTTQFDKSDLINFMYEQGANYVDTDIKITIREYDTEATRTTRKMTDSRYVIRTDTVSHYYTNTDELSGVVQI